MYEYQPWLTPSRIEAFEGRWLTDPPHNPADGSLPMPWEKGREKHPEWYTHVAETVHGRIAVYIHHYNFGYDQPPLFEVFEDLDAARQKLAGNKQISQDRLNEAGYQLGRNGKRGEEVRWRDI